MTNLLFHILAKIVKTCLVYNPFQFQQISTNQCKFL